MSTAIPFAVQPALWLPPHHLAQLALRVIGASSNKPVLLHAGALAAAAVLFTGIAYVGYRKDEGKQYG